MSFFIFAVDAAVGYVSDCFGQDGVDGPLDFPGGELAGGAAALVEDVGVVLLAEEVAAAGALDQLARLGGQSQADGAGEELGVDLGLGHPLQLD